VRRRHRNYSFIGLFFLVFLLSPSFAPARGAKVLPIEEGDTIAEMRYKIASNG